MQASIPVRQQRCRARRRQVLSGLGGLAALACAASVLPAAPAMAQAARYEIDPTHLSVGFLVEHIGYAKVLGMFRTARGSYRFDDYWKFGLPLLLIWLAIALLVIPLVWPFTP